MYTQCSKCVTVFRLSAQTLRAAGGQVRCGRCGEVFNALSRLAEDARAFSRGESPLELESRADAILQASAAAAEDVAPPADDIARLRVLDPGDEWESEASLEFTLPPGDLDRIFIQVPTVPVPHLSILPLTAGHVPGLDVSEDVRREMQLGHDERALHNERALHDDGSGYALPAHDPLTGPDPQAHDELREHDELRAHADLAQFGARKLPPAAWISAAVVLALLLAAQLFQNGEWRKRGASSNGGSARSPAAALSAYQLRQWGVSGDPQAKATLRVRASIMNITAQLQPYPLLKVTLADRFGTRIAARDFEPAEYSGAPVARQLAPGERVDVVLDILDPGSDAESFEIDLCVRGADKTTVCAADAAAPAKS